MTYYLVVIQMMPSVQTLIFGMTTVLAARRSSRGIENAISGMSNSCDAVLSFRNKFPFSWGLLTEQLGIADATIESELLSRAEDYEPEPSREISEEAKRIFPLTMQIQMQCKSPMMSAPVKGAMKACTELVRSRKTEVTEVDFLRELLSQDCLAADVLSAYRPLVDVLEAIDSLPAERKHFDPYQNIRETIEAILPGQSELIKLPEGVTWEPPKAEFKERTPEPDHIPSETEIAFNEDLLRDLAAAKVVQQEFLDPVLRPDHVFLMFLRRPNSEIRRHLEADGQNVEDWIVEIAKSLKEIEPYAWNSEMHHEIGDLLPKCHVFPEIANWWKRADGTIAEPEDADFEEVTTANGKKAFDQPYSEMLWLGRIHVHDDSQFAQLYEGTTYHDSYYEDMRKRYEKPFEL